MRSAAVWHRGRRNPQGVQLIVRIHWHQLYSRRSPCKTELQPLQSNVVRYSIRQKLWFLLGYEVIYAKKNP